MYVYWDNQVQVHLIEARDLAAKNFDGTSDPVVYVECFDQKQNTKVIYATVNCVFDEVLIFNIKKCAKAAPKANELTLDRSSSTRCTMPGDSVVA